MKLKLTLVNVSFVVYVIGILSSVGLGIQVGAVLILFASILMLSAYVIQISQSVRFNGVWTLENLMYSIGILVVGIIFSHGFSVVISLPLLGNVPIFNTIYLLAGVLLAVIFSISSIMLKVKGEKNKSNRIYISVISLFIIIAILGLLGLAGIVPLPGSFNYYGWVLLLLYFLAYAINYFRSSVANVNGDKVVFLVLCIIMVVYWCVRFNMTQLVPNGLFKAVVFLGFVPLIALPISIIFFKKQHFYTAFIIYSILINFYFIHTDKNLQYLIAVGLNGCDGYEDATNYPVNYDPGQSVEMLLSKPTLDEVAAVLNEWKQKDFSPERIQVEYSEIHANGDSLKVISHLVNGKKHYGLIRLPKGINVKEAPLLLGLYGGGTDVDVLKTDDIFRLSTTRCRQLLNNYISIMPSFRGNILRGEKFCFRSEGYAGDAWLGAAEDAVAMLEVVKSMYNNTGNNNVLAKGVSRGATVALIVGALTDKLDYIIANSTHSNFLDQQTLQLEIVGSAYSKAFYTPKATPAIIRNRVLASSPYFFVKYLPPFELHQNSEDHKTTIRHAALMIQQLKALGRSENTHKVYVYQGEGHGHEDESKVCNSLKKYQ